MFPPQFAQSLLNIFLTYQTFVTNLHLLRVELRFMLHGSLAEHCASIPKDVSSLTFHSHRGQARHTFQLAWCGYTPLSYYNITGEPARG